MGMIEPAIDDVIGVVAMGNSLMSTTWPVNMAILMIDRLAMVWVFLTHFQAVLIAVLTMLFCGAIDGYLLQLRMG